MSPDKEKQSHSEPQARDHERSRSKEKDQEKAASKPAASKPAASKQSGETRSRSETQSRAKTENKSSKSSHAEHTHLPAGKSATTTDHNTIRQWIEERGGSPASVKATESGNDPGLLRINFPGYSGEDRLEDIPWDEFFKKFDEKKLAFLYQDETRAGETSRFWKFVSREGNEKGESKSKKS